MSNLYQKILQNNKMLQLIILPLNLFQATSSRFDPEIKNTYSAYLNQACHIDTCSYANDYLNQSEVLGESKLIDIAFEDFKEFLKELQQKSGCG